MNTLLDSGLEINHVSSGGVSNLGILDLLSSRVTRDLEVSLTRVYEVEREKHIDSSSHPYELVMRNPIEYKDLSCIVCGEEYLHEIKALNINISHSPLKYFREPFSIEDFPSLLDWVSPQPIPHYSAVVDE